MSFGHHNAINQHPLQENQFGTPAVDSQEQPHNRCVYPQPRPWVLPQQHLGKQQSYEEQYNTCPCAYGTYSHQLQLSFNHYPNESMKSQARHVAEPFKDNSGIDSAKGSGILSGFGSSYCNKLTVAHSNSINNANWRTHQLEPQDAGRDVAGKKHAI